MFSDGYYLFDAGWLFFAAWSIVLLTIFVITFGKDLLGDPQGRANPPMPNAQSPRHSANFPNR